MAVTALGPRQIPNIGNFENLVGEVVAYNSSTSQSPVNLNQGFCELSQQLVKAGIALGEPYKSALVTPLMKHLNDRADAEEAKSFNRMRGGYTSETSSDFYTESSESSLTAASSFSLASSSYDYSLPRGIILQWTDRQRINSFSMELSKMEEDVIKAILLHGEACSSTSYNDVFCKTTSAAQKAIISLYKDFIDCERSNGVSFCRNPPVAPLLSWGSGPATWTEKDTQIIGIKNVAIVHLPIGNSIGGIFAWTTLAHEVSGHDLLASAGLINELYQNVQDSLRSRGISLDVTNYWTREKRRIDEIASDVVGVINLGPAAAIGLIGYLKGLSPNQKLRPNGPVEDEHPADILRGLVVANVVNQLAIQNRAQWSSLLYAKVLEDWPKNPWGDLTPIYLDGKGISSQEAMRSAEIVSNSILNDPLRNLKGMSLQQVRIWDMEDQQIADTIGACLSGRVTTLPSYCLGQKIEEKYAKHIVAATTIESLKSGSNSANIFSNMIELLQRV